VEEENEPSDPDMQRILPAAGAALLVVALSACAHTYEPIVDMKGVDPARYQGDLAECRAYADEVGTGGETARSGFGGALLGSALGAIAGAFGGSAGSGAALGAGIGGVGGAASGAGQGVQRQEQVIDNCLRHRGYAVLG
jgi:outer membrane lipoprotein SlyB